MATKPYPLRVPDNLMELVEAKAREERTDKSTVLRQLLYAGAEDYVLRLLSEERISLARAAELLDVDHRRMQRLAGRKGIETSPTLEEHERGLETARSVLRR